VIRPLLAGALALGLGAWAVAGAAPLERTLGPLRLETTPQGERALAALSLRAPSILSGLEASLGLVPARPIRVVLIPPGPVLAPEVARLELGVPAWAAGYAVPAERTAVVRLAQSRQYPYGTPESVLAHEITHLMVHDAVGDRLPLWFEEGVATWASRPWRLEDLMILSAQFLSQDLPTFDRLDPQFHSTAPEAEQAYAASFAFVSWSANRYGQGFPGEVIRRTRWRPFALAWEAASGEPLERAERTWRRESLIRYKWLPILTASGTLWLVVLLIAFLAWWRKRSRIARLRETWEHETPEPWYDEALEPDPANAGARTAGVEGGGGPGGAGTGDEIR
jgi:hypothetical protein